MACLEEEKAELLSQASAVLRAPTESDWAAEKYELEARVDELCAELGGLLTEKVLHIPAVLCTWTVHKDHSRLTLFAHRAAWCCPILSPDLNPAYASVYRTDHLAVDYC